MRTSPRADLVFVGPGLSCFEQLAADATRRGLRTSWIGYAESWPRLAVRRAFVRRVSQARNVEGIAEALAAVGAADIADVQASEYVLADTVAAAHVAGVRPELASELDRRLRLSDKLVTSQLLAAAGVRVPDVVDAGTTGAAGAAERLGLPVVVKGRVANGGTSVRIAATVAEADAAVAAVSRRGGAFFERFVTGEASSYSASYQPGGALLHDVVYLTERVDGGLGPPDRIRVVDRPEVLATGRAVVRALGGSGLVNVNLITDGEGRSWVHDVNLRPWGTMFALREAGIDFPADYLDLLGLGRTSRLPPPETTRSAFLVFPGAALAQANTDVLEGLSVFADQGLLYAQWVGVGYVAVEALKGVVSLTRGRVRAVRGVPRTG